MCHRYPHQPPLATATCFEFGSFRFRYCFVFRYSDFGFQARRLPHRLSYPVCQPCAPFYAKQTQSRKPQNHHNIIYQKELHQYSTPPHEKKTNPIKPNRRSNIKYRASSIENRVSTYSLDNPPIPPYNQRRFCTGFTEYFG